ncbi:uncharacterized protein LOC144099981 [Amblyomma americanum]
MARYLLRSNSPRVLLVRSRSRSPSLETLTPAGRIAGQRLVRRYQAKARRHWKEIFASFVLIACCVMVVTFIIGWNRKLGSGKKPFRGSRQRGTFGLPDPTQAQNPENTEEQDVYRPVQQAAPQTVVTKHRKAALTANDVQPTTAAKHQPDAPASQDIKTSKVTVSALTDSRVECATLLCKNLKDWLHKTVARQADPCKERNTFVCDPSVSFAGFSTPFAKRTVLAKAFGGDDITKKQQHTFSGEDGERRLLKSCLEYAESPDEGVEDIAAFMSHFQLDLRHMVDDPAEDPLDRMMELSLDYGIDSPVSFSRKYNVTGEASAPFVFEITLNPEVKEFLNGVESLDDEEVEDLYDLLLARYALLNDSDVTKQLIDADDDIADLIKHTKNSAQPDRMSIANLAETTTVRTDRWRQLFARFGHSEAAVYEHVAADEQAVAFLAYRSQSGGKLGMRRVLAWHVLRYLVGPKADFLSELNRTRAAGDILEDDIFIASPERKCGGLVSKVSGVAYRALDILEGTDVVPVQTIVDVTRLMAEFQDAISSVFTLPKGQTGNLSAVAVASQTNHVPLFAGRMHGRSHPGNLFTAFDGLSENASGLTEDLATGGRSFPLAWLRRLRAWHSLPPLVQALLPAMASVAKVAQPAALFRPPYYDVTAPPAYNFAALGQIIAQAMAHELVNRRGEEEETDARWQRLWERTDAVDADSVYCMRAAFNKNGTWRQTRVDEKELAGRAALDEALGTKIAIMAFLSARREGTAGQNGPMMVLPGVELSSKQFFFVMHCALSCARAGSGADAVRTLPPTDQRCMVVYNTRKQAMDKPCGQLGGREIPNECRYI